MYIIIHTRLMPTEAITTHGGPRLPADPVPGSGATSFYPHQGYALSHDSFHIVRQKVLESRPHLTFLSLPSSTHPLAHPSLG